MSSEHLEGLSLTQSDSTLLSTSDWQYSKGSSFELFLMFDLEFYTGVVCFLTLAKTIHMSRCLCSVHIFEILSQVYMLWW